MYYLNKTYKFVIFISFDKVSNIYIIIVQCSCRCVEASSLLALTFVLSVSIRYVFAFNYVQ